MKTTKLFVSSVVALALSSSALVAEESGVFVGVGVGYGGSQIKVDGDKTNLKGISYEIIAGYKQFFTQDFGLRYYANFAYADASKKASGDVGKTTGSHTYNVGVRYIFSF